MSFILTFWMIFLMDSIIVLISFSIFLSVWICALIIATVLTVTKINNIYCTWDFISSKFIDTYWFVLGMMFILCLLLRLCLLLYFSCINFVSFDLCKVIGFQWYWVYFLFGETTIFSNLILESDYLIGDLRILQCNHVLTLLSLVIYKLWVSAVDVIHSFTISSLGIKVDCIPGRCNEIILFATNNATLYGQCSELCGVLHGFMPIVINFI
uniref:Cytochrome c oxidase subunit 2 n=1 Tax=Trypanosoma brucei brucei TaxID=5702 RepID=COX2_TRYBB|nr:RecName: Full=Cytochrome c oxidase subunit 2; AltName: Full=Cytochrome c oxidase polypeptide II [Trypanosoma brucei brucei]